MQKSDMMVAAQDLGWPVQLDSPSKNSGGLVLIHRIKPGSEKVILAHLESARFQERIEAARKVHFLQIFFQGVERLVMVGRFDAPGAESFIEFYCDNQDLLDGLWCNCKGFPDASHVDADSLMAFFQSGLQDYAFNYTAIPQVKLGEFQRALDWMKKTVRYQIELAKTPRRR